MTWRARHRRIPTPFRYTAKYQCCRYGGGRAPHELVVPSLSRGIRPSAFLSVSLGLCSPKLALYQTLEEVRVLLEDVVEMFGKESECCLKRHAGLCDCQSLLRVAGEEKTSRQ